MGGGWEGRGYRDAGSVYLNQIPNLRPTAVGNMDFTNVICFPNVPGS